MRAFRESIWGLMLVVIIIGGIYSGSFTATEAAAMARSMRSSSPCSSTRRSAQGRAARAAARREHQRDAALHHHQRGAVLVCAQPTRTSRHALADWIAAQNLGWVGFLLRGQHAAADRRQLHGAVLDHPDHGADPGAGREELGIDPVHFGIVIDVNMEVGLCHPPVGLNLYVASMIARMRITELAVAVLPWLVTMLVFLVIVDLLA